MHKRRHFPQADVALRGPAGGGSSHRPAGREVAAAVSEVAAAVCEVAAAVRR